MIQLFKVFIPTSVLTLLASETILIFGCYIAASFWSYRAENGPLIFLIDENGLISIIFVTMLIILGLYFNDLYSEFRVYSRMLLIQQICLTLGVAFVLEALSSYVRSSWGILPQKVMVLGSLLVLTFLFGWRLLYASTIWRAVALKKVLFLGSSPLVFELADYLVTHPKFGYVPIGYLDENLTIGAPDSPDSSLKRLGLVDDLSPTVQDQKPSNIIVGMKERRHKLPVSQLLECRFAGIHTEEIANLYETTYGRVCTREIRPSQLVFSREFGPRGKNQRFQRIYSAFLALIGLIITAPVMVIVALLVKLTSSGPILYRQTRVGLHNKHFTLYKFRSMRQDAEVSTGAVWATRNDPRITRLGFWLRKLRLDELPQLINVLRADMSIVGPRPERPEFVEVFYEQIPYYRQRHSVPPGITGWAQINYKYGDTIEDTITKLEYDLYYIKYSSFSLDLYIMFHTAKTMMLFRGAQ